MVFHTLIRIGCIFGKGVWFLTIRKKTLIPLHFNGLLLGPHEGGIEPSLGGALGLEEVEVRGEENEMKWGGFFGRAYHGDATWCDVRQMEIYVLPF